MFAALQKNGGKEKYRDGAKARDIAELQNTASDEVQNKIH